MIMKDQNSGAILKRIHVNRKAVCFHIFFQRFNLILLQDLDHILIPSFDHFIFSVLCEKYLIQRTDSFFRDHSVKISAFHDIRLVRINSIYLHQFFSDLQRYWREFVIIIIIQQIKTVSFCQHGILACIPHLIFLSISLLTSGSAELTRDQEIRTLFNDMYIVASSCNHNSSKKSFQTKEKGKHGQDKPFPVTGNISPRQITHFPGRGPFSFRENRLSFLVRSFFTLRSCISGTFHTGHPYCSYDHSG